MTEHRKTGRATRRRHSAEFKAHVVAECSRPGMSMAAVALSNGLNANLLRRWVVQSEANRVMGAAAAGEPSGVPVALEAAQPGFVAVNVPRQLQAEPVEVELKQGSLQVRVRWPAESAGALGVWLRELLR